MKEDAKTAEANPQVKEGFCGMTIRGMHYEDKLTAGERLLAACQELPSAEPVEIGSYRGFPMELSYNAFHNQFEVAFKGLSNNHVFLGTDARGNITRLDNALDNFPERIEKAENHLGTLIQQRDAAQAELGKPLSTGGRTGRKICPSSRAGRPSEHGGQPQPGSARGRKNGGERRRPQTFGAGRAESRRA